MDQPALFVTCLPGLEDLLGSELAELGLDGLQPDAGGIALPATWQSVHRIQLYSGLATSLRWRVAAFGARSLADLDKRGARVDWRAWLPVGCDYKVKARCRRSRIYHSGAAEQRILTHLHDQLGTADTAGGEDTQQIHLRIDNNQCLLSLDLSGAPLHRRGYRLRSGPAPLREDLAHAAVLLSGWDRQSPLLDPMCGTGTLAIEAAALARGLGPGRLRRFACEALPGHEPELLAQLRGEAQSGLLAAGALPFAIHGADRDPDAVAATRSNAEVAGVAADLQLREQAMSESFAALEPGPRGAVLCNPPYGARIGDKDQLGKLYRALGEACRRLPPGWQYCLVVGDRRLGLKTGLKLHTACLVDSGGSKVRVLCKGASPNQPAAPSTSD